jgi:hypothetical protein
LEITQYCNEFGITGKEICLANVARLWGVAVLLSPLTIRD